MKKKMIIVVLMGLSLTAWGIYRHYSKTASPQPDAVLVQTTKVQESSLPLEAHAIGSLVARSVEITPESAGHVDHIFFQDGAFVKKDTVLIKMDDADYKAKYESA